MDYTEPEILNVETEECENSKIRYIFPQVFKVIACAKQIIFWFKPRASIILLAKVYNRHCGLVRQPMGRN
jgi:hypothetical protein